MHFMRRFLSSALAASLVTMPLYAGPKPPNKGDKGNDGDEIRHVLLISVDGLHALDLSNYCQHPSRSTLALPERSWNHVHERQAPRNLLTHFPAWRPS